jgi:DNA-directed RNA polymerase subunit RPC12/RpoP
MNEASFLTRCVCGILYKLTSIEDVYECPNCSLDVTVKVNHHLSPREDGVLRRAITKQNQFL